MGADDHRLVDDGDGRVRALAAFERQPRLREGLAHEQLVVHGPMLADGSRASVSADEASVFPVDAESQPERTGGTAVA